MLVTRNISGQIERNTMAPINDEFEIERLGKIVMLIFLLVFFGLMVSAEFFASSYANEEFLRLIGFGMSVFCATLLASPYLSIWAKRGPLCAADDNYATDMNGAIVFIKPALPDVGRD
jgi:hypothetical protein